MIFNPSFMHFCTGILRPKYLKHFFSNYWFVDFVFRVKKFLPEVEIFSSKRVNLALRKSIIVQISDLKNILNKGHGITREQGSLIKSFISKSADKNGSLGLFAYLPYQYFLVSHFFFACRFARPVIRKIRNKNK